MNTEQRRSNTDIVITALYRSGNKGERSDDDPIPSRRAPPVNMPRKEPATDVTQEKKAMYVGRSVSGDADNCRLVAARLHPLQKAAPIQLCSNVGQMLPGTDNR